MKRLSRGIIPIPLLVGVLIMAVLIVFSKNPPFKSASELSSDQAPSQTPTASLTPTPTTTPTQTPSLNPEAKPTTTLTPTPTQTTTLSQTPPASGYARISVKTDLGTFTVSLGSADLATTRIVVDTASQSDCFDNCPVLPLATYVAQNGAYAGINGSYFCPADYASCSGKSNTFDLLVMNKNKTYFNSDNNVYSSNPGVIFGEGYIRFVGSVSEWGRDTSPNGVLSNYPLLVSGGSIVYGGSSDPKMNNRGGRSFVANKGNTVYIGVVQSATIAESASVMKALGMDNALNLDDGGSTALWWGGYKVGPGRSLPNVILFIAK
jgi:hypothetical protein